MSRAPVRVALEIDIAGAWKAFERLGEQVIDMQERLMQAFAPVAAAAASAARFHWGQLDRYHVTFWAIGTGPDARRHRRRCARCNPRGYRRPLPINGHEYHRRTRNRRKR